MVPCAPRFARASLTSFRATPACPGTHPRVTGIIALRRRSAARASLMIILLVRFLALPSTLMMAYLLSVKVSRGRRGIEGC